MARNIFKAILVMLICASLAGADVKKYYVPETPLWGNPANHSFDPITKEFVNTNYLFDNWVLGKWDDHTERQRVIDEIKKPKRTPSKTRYMLELKPKLFLKPDSILETAVLGSLKRRRLVLINPESNTNSPPSLRMYSHLGILSVATVADEEGCETVLWDELVQGQADLESLIQPGDIVGFSTLITGADRTTKLAQKAKQLGAICTIAGNDTAIFRANQFLSLPDKPIDAVFTSNSLNSVRRFLREFDGRNLSQLVIPEMQTQPGATQHSNIRPQLEAELKARKQLKSAGLFDEQDGFIVPKFNLFPAEYWHTVESNFRTVFGHKHQYGKPIKNRSVLLRQGCTRTQGVNACSYCSIYGVGDVRVPKHGYTSAILEACEQEGATEINLMTDSAFEMEGLVRELEEIGAHPEALTIYARAQGIAMNPKLLERWLRIPKSHLLLNVGMDSGDDGILQGGIGKSSVKGKGSRLAENKAAILALLGTNAHLHYSVIFGSPGETHESCKRTVEFVVWTLATLGQQVDLVESDLYWLNFGAPVEEVFRSYRYAQRLATMAEKTISPEEWFENFGSKANELVVPWETERAYYRFFTNITLEEAQDYNSLVVNLMEQHTGAIDGRAFFPRKEDNKI